MEPDGSTLAESAMTLAGSDDRLAVAGETTGRELFRRSTQERLVLLRPHRVGQARYALRTLFSTSTALVRPG